MNEVQKFMGLVEYLAQFMLDISAYIMPLTEIQRNGHPFQWRDIHKTCFQTIKVLACCHHSNSVVRSVPSIHVGSLKIILHVMYCMVMKSVRLVVIFDQGTKVLGWPHALPVI